MKELKSIMVTDEDFIEAPIENYSGPRNLYNLKDQTIATNYDVVIYVGPIHTYILKNRYGCQGRIISHKEDSAKRVLKEKPQKSVAQSKKQFYDWLDRNRPWNKPENKDSYKYMEELVNHAAMFFCDERFATIEEVERLEKGLIKVTKDLSDHPDGYDGPCMCYECRTSG